MKIHGYKLKAGLIYGLTQKFSSEQLAREIDLYEEDLQKLSRQGVVELKRWQVEKLACLLDVDVDFFTKE